MYCFHPRRINRGHPGAPKRIPMLRAPKLLKIAVTNSAFV
jgi:hypothetical protein